jgi:hypothetical protein
MQCDTSGQARDIQGRKTSEELCWYVSYVQNLVLACSIRYRKLARAAQELSVPFIASGGFADGRGLASALALGCAVRSRSDVLGVILPSCLILIDVGNQYG